ncbi:hypothetical protein [Metabacillus bambusae]|uniref:Uncharacterized protein n=1 Tax=Metabacillus bambusae TaxID=2795218 RepID=A0ABS3N4K7_9BACI|nr:hypothetical protein [Metabacillus bambusae]MBO1513241.1 hypothetical protein [Metabacillus bambusae]
MNKEGYFVTCSKCEGNNIKYDYENTIFNTKTGETVTPVRCLECNYETV